MNMVPNEKIEKYLDELSLEYKELLFKALLERSSSLEELSVSELLRIDNEIKKPLLENTTSKRQKRLMSLGWAYIFTGICMFLISLVIEQISGTSSLYTLFMLFSLIIIMVGGLSILMSIFISNKKIGKPKSDNNDISNIKILQYEIISTWRAIEGIYSDIGMDMNNNSIPYVMNNLVNNNVISQNEMVTLKLLLKIRNSIVHSSGIEYSMIEMKNVLEQSQAIIQKMKRIM